jgi:serine protease Do
MTLSLLSKQLIAAAAVLGTAGLSCGQSANESQEQVKQVALATPPSPAPAVKTAAPPGLNQPSLANLVESVKSAVVNVDVQARARMPQLPPEMSQDFFERFFGGPGGPDFRAPQQAPIRQGSGSGFLIDPNGLVLTNNHVVEGAVNIRVKLDDGRSFDAEILGRDPLTDIALLKLKGDAKNLPYAKLGDSDAMRVGDYVVAIGNPFGLASSVSAGIISARARDIRAGPYDDFLQTDAAINPGNSGGPLFNLSGEVIGINTAIIGGGTGIGFAVPSNMAKALVPQLQKGEVLRGWLGIGIQDLTPDLAKALNVPGERGAVVAEVNPGTPAQKAGLEAEDVVVALDGQPIESAKDLTRSVGFKRPGTAVALTVYRQGKKQDFRVELGRRPDEPGMRRQAPGREEEENTSEKLGLGFQDVDPRMGANVREGAAIVQVTPGSPAERAELRPGMVVVEAGGKPVRNAQDLYRALKDAKSGSTLLLRIDVGGSKALRALAIP